MDFTRDDNSSDEWENDVDANTNNRHEKKGYHRHTNEQIHRLETYFKECPHPDEFQRRLLGEELNLKPKQIKFWFQNKRTQAKSHNEKADNAALRAENIKIRRENESMEDALNNVVCPPCGGRGPGREDQLRHLQKLRAQNAYLKDEYERVSNYLKQYGGHSMHNVEATPYLHGPSNHASTSKNRPALYGTSSNRLPEPSSIFRGPYTRGNMNTTAPPQPRKPLEMQNFQPLSQLEKIAMLEAAEKAVSEVLSLIQMDDTMWKKSSIDDRLVIDPGLYEKYFTKTNTNGRPESSKDVVVVQMDAGNLIDIFLTAEKWARLFPTIVNEAKTIHVLDSVDHRGKTFSRVIYEQLHILSPLVPPREFMILRTCQQIEDNVWMIADVSCHLPNIEFDLSFPICTKRPSGVLIQALPHGFSKVTWIEHVVVNDNRVRPHKLYRDLLYGGFGYGARRWTVTLERTCERLIFSTSVPALPNNDNPGVVQTIRGRNSVMHLGERMLRNFAWMMKMVNKLDFSPQSETNNSGIRIGVRINNETGQPPGLIVCAGSSLSLPLPPVQVYDFLKNLEVRHQWDVLCHGNPATEAARFVTGSNPRNTVSFLEPSIRDINTKLMILQDSFKDALGGMVAYAPMDLNTACAAISGDIDPTTIPILPSGFMISRDGRPSEGEAEGGSYTLLTVAFQILVSGPSYSPDTNLEVSATTVNTLISSTVQRIKAMLKCE
ncbi:Homeobox-leucine zipper protein HDG9 [Arabidopsis thaliana]